MLLWVEVGVSHHRMEMTRVLDQLLPQVVDMGEVPPEVKSEDPEVAVEVYEMLTPPNQDQEYSGKGSQGESRLTHSEEVEVEGQVNRAELTHRRTFLVEMDFSSHSSHR